MAGISHILKAPTRDELEGEVARWYEEIAADGFGRQQLPWDPAKVVEAEDGYEFAVRAQS
jgi:hypothetical protein